MNQSKLVSLAKKSISFLTILATILLSFGPGVFELPVALAASTIVVSTTELVNASPGAPIKASSAPQAIARISVTTNQTDRVLQAVTVNFSGTKFATLDLLALATDGTSGVALYAEDLPITLNLPTWLGTNVTLTPASPVPLTQNVAAIFYVVIKTSNTITNGDIIVATIPTNGVITSDGNGPAADFSAPSLIADTIAPTVNIVVTNTVLKIGGTSIVTFTFNEAVTGFANVDVVLTNASGTISVIEGGPVVYTATFTPTANIEDATNVIAVDKTGVADIAGNAGVDTTNSNNYAIDTKAPTVASAAAFTDRIIIQFSEQVNGMQASNCDNYTVGGTALTCGGMGLPFIDFQGNKATIRGLSLSGTTSLVISGNIITDMAQNPLAVYSSGSLNVSALSLPSITGIANNDGVSGFSGKVGDTITITGTNFGDGPADANHKVFFSGGFNPETGPLPPVEVSSYTSWSTTSIVVVVPAGAKGGPVNVMVNGVMNDMGPHSFFDIFANYVAKVYYNNTNNLMPDEDKDKIRFTIGGMRGPVVYYDGDGVTTYDAANDQFTITGVSSMGWAWAYNIEGTHLNSQGRQVDVSAAQNHILKATSRKISGTITLGTPCTDSGKNKNVVVFAMPDQVDFGSADFKPMDPAFFKTGNDCTVNYSVGIPMNGVYRVEAHIPPDPTSATIGSSAFTDPDALSVAISDSALTAAGKNFTFLAATHRIIGTVQKPAGAFGAAERGMLWVFAYQPREGGKGTGTQVGSDGKFTLYVTKGAWKVGVGGENMSFPVEVQVDVDDTYLIANPAKGPTIIIAPPSDFIEGYVKDSAGNGLANVSLYAWREGGPGGGNARTDSQGYYKMYVTPGSGYRVGAHSQTYGFLGEQSGISVTSDSRPTVNFNVSSSDNFTISGTITKGGAALQQAFVFITDGEYGSMLGSGGTDATGAYTVRVSGGSNRWLHVGLPAKGKVYAENLGTISGNVSKNIAITSSTIIIKISPSSAFSQAFVGVQSDQGGGFSDTDVSSESPDTYREYQIDVRRPASGSTTYYVDGGIPGYGPLPQVPIGVNSNGTFTETSGTANDGIIEITLGNLYTVSGTVSGDNVKDAWVWAAGPNGGNGGAVAENGTYSMKLKDGTYDVGVGKPGYIGNKITITVDGDKASQNLTLTTTDKTITGKVYLPDGTSVATNAWVWAEDGIGGWAGGSTDASGNYTLNVSSGGWTVKAAYDGYNSTGILVTAPASGKNITLIAISGFTPNTKNSPITPSDGGIVRGAGIKVDFPKNALGTGNTAGTVEVKSTTNVVLKNDRQLVGTAKEITARNNSNQNITTLSGSITIELTVSKAELQAANLTLAQAQALKITYFDSTGGSWVEIPTVVTLSVPTAITIAELSADPALTLTGITSHLSVFAPSIPTDPNAPPTPTGLSASVGNGSAALSWTASTGATKYNIYKKVGADYPYLAQTTAVSYTATGLTNGTTYYFKVSALDATNKESAATAAASVTPYISGGGGGTYTPPAPTTPTTTTGQMTATASAGGKTTLTTAEATKAIVELPANAVTADTVVKAESVAVATVTAAAPAPAGKTIASAFNLTATSAGVAVTSFTKIVTITLTYTDAQIIGLNEATLKIYRRTGAEWVALTSTVNAATNTITATTTAFSYFAIIGEPPAVVSEVTPPVKPIAEMTITELKAEITRIATLIAQFQVELAKLIAGPQSFTTDLYYGLKVNSEVKRLQEFMISKGYLATGLNTGNYYTLTVAAVKAYQSAKGITPVAGYFGPKTKAAVNADLGI